MEPRWTPALRLDALTPGQPQLFSQGGHKIVLVRDGDAVYAVDNACPHEGYPLVQGTLKGCVLTCSWHNFKFDLRDGRCVKGEEDVRSYGVRVVDGVVQLDLAEPDRGAWAEPARESLRAALFEGRLGQASRDLVRLLMAGVSAPRILGELAAYDAGHAEWGSSHALAVSADMLGLLARYPGTEAALLLAQPAELIIYDNARRAARERPEPESPPADPERAFALLRERVEAEDAQGAEALLRGAIEGGWGRAILEPWFVRLCADHFIGFGHPLIYTPKAFDLLDQAGWDLADEILGALLLRVVSATREDVLPGWRAWTKRVSALRPELPRLYGLQVRGGPAWWDRQGLIDALLDARPSEALEAMIRRMEEGVPTLDLVGALTTAAAERVLRFDPEVELSAELQDGWLDVSHILTFSRAIREAAERVQHPELLLLLLQATRFVNHARSLDLPPERRLSPTPAPRSDAEGVLEAARRHDAEEALGCARAALEAGQEGPLRDALVDYALRYGSARVIFPVHLLKTTLAGFAEREELLGEPGADKPALAAVRLVVGPMRDRTVESVVRDARGFVEEGRVPKRRT